MARVPTQQEILNDPLDIPTVNRSGQEFSKKDLVRNKLIGLYFSGNWSPPCRRFTPVLIDAVGKINREYGSNSFDVVFISHDASQAEFDNHVELMPWYMVAFDNLLVSASLKVQFDVASIPRLVVLDNQGRLILENARGPDFFGVGLDPLAAYQKLEEMKKAKDAAAKEA